jgi:hypothetical protein
LPYPKPSRYFLFGILYRERPPHHRLRLNPATQSRSRLNDSREFPRQVNKVHIAHKMMAQMNGGSRPMRDHEDDSDDEVLATTLAEAMQEEDGDYDEAGSNVGFQVTGDDLQARLTAAATPLEFQAGLPVRFASYDNYCSLFHFILNSDGPVDLDLPTVSGFWICGDAERQTGASD